MSDQQYSHYKDLVAGTRLPAAFLDLDLLDKNIHSILSRAKDSKIRIASKSIRSVEVLKYIQEKSDRFLGFMTFTLEETVHLSKAGLDNFLLGYPSLQSSLLRALAQEVKQGKNIVLMVDLEAHLETANRVAKEEGISFKVCMDVDCSTKHMGIYFGVYRSSITTATILKERLELTKQLDNVQVVGLMGYEAQVAGVTDNLKGAKTKVIRMLKKQSIPTVAARRKQMFDVYNEVLGERPEIFNAGGTGSIESSIEEDWVNEVTVGSGFYSSWLFDGFQGFKHEPAAFYGVEVVRNPVEGIYTAHGGGYVASGSVGADKAPLPCLPKGMKFMPNEGAGEVQTPLRYDGKLKLGDPVFFRHAKAGELCERFNELYTIREKGIVGSYKTYRGEGKCFL
jgi:D-serine deaminase-like pyridoxal phosphate-dependent protein